MTDDKPTHEELLARSRAIPARRRHEAATSLLARARALGSEVRQALETQQFGADDIQMETYNDIAANAAFLFPDDPTLSTSVVMPDAALQSYGTPWASGRIMTDDITSVRLNARLTRLINGLEGVLGEPNHGDPRAHATDDAVSRGKAPIKIQVPEGLPNSSIFVSHSSADNEFAERLSSALTGLGLQVWYDDWEIKVGDSITDKVNQGLAEHDYLCVVLSEASVASEWVRKEVNAALVRSIREKRAVLLPIRIDDCTVPPLMADIKTADFRSSFLSGLSRLLDAIASQP